MENLTEAQLAEAREAFAVFDKDLDGTISTAELGKIFRALGQNATDEEVTKIIQRYDLDNSGTVDFEEFVAMITAMGGLGGQGGAETDMRDTFRTFDLDGDGLISAKELQHVFQALGEDIPTEEVERMIAEADINKDGGVSYEEFVVMMNS